MNQKSTEKWGFIINPVAGNGFANTYLDTIHAKINEHQVDAELVFTERKGHASELAQQFAERGFRYIIGVGGDGTLNEIARPLIHNTDVVVGIVPAGTGNDFIQILGFPNRFTDADWDVLFQKNTIPMDVGSCNGMIFLNGMGLGFDAQVAAENYQGPGEVKRGGKHKYLWHIIKTLLFFKEKQMTVLSNGNTGQTSCFINTIAIGRRFAGGFFLTPKAIANDGLLDVCMIKQLSLLERFKILLKVPKGTHIEDEKVHYYQTDKIELSFTEKVPFHVDGELFFASAFAVELLSQGLTVVYNPHGDHYFNS